jgi:hypothetical protein
MRAYPEYNAWVLAFRSRATRVGNLAGGAHAQPEAGQPPVIVDRAFGWALRKRRHRSPVDIDHSQIATSYRHRVATGHRQCRHLRATLATTTY